jgi:acetolactate synthase-like protein
LRLFQCYSRGALQDIDQLTILRSLCKYTARVTRLRDIVPTLRQAIKVAQSDTPGPVFIEFPIDVLYPYQIVVKEAGFSKEPRGIKVLIETYLFAYISWQFGSAWAPQDITPLAVSVPTPKPEVVEQIADLILSSERPVILLV